jgi:putative transposase
MINPQLCWGDSHRFDRDNGECIFFARLKVKREQPIRDYKSLSHTRWDCKYHIVFIPKRRQKLIYGVIRRHLGETFHELAKRKGVTIEEGHLMKDHVHMCLSIPPK